MPKNNKGSHIREDGEPLKVENARSVLFDPDAHSF